MNAPETLVLHAADWFDLFAHYLTFSLMAIGGALSTLPEMHRYLVEQQHWLSDAQFNAAITIAQAAPGPNVLFVALLGWNVGLNAGGLPAALLGALLTLSGNLLPCMSLAFVTARWAHRNRELPAIRAFKMGMGPIVIALLVATGWILASAHKNPASDWPLWVLTALTALIIWRSKIHLLWLLVAGAVLGGAGLV